MRKVIFSLFLLALSTIIVQHSSSISCSDASWIPKPA